VNWQQEENDRQCYEAEERAKAEREALAQRDKALMEAGAALEAYMELTGCDIIGAARMIERERPDIAARLRERANG
jgi:hypothetical protein